MSNLGLCMLTLTHKQTNCCQSRPTATGLAPLLPVSPDRYRCRPTATGYKAKITKAISWSLMIPNGQKGILG